MITEHDVKRQLPPINYELLNQIPRGKATPLTCKMLSIRSGIKDTRELRLELNALLEAEYPVIGCAKGYYIADNPADVQSNIANLKSYIVNIQHHITLLERAAKNINGQSRML